MKHYSIITAFLFLATASVHAKSNLRGNDPDGDWEKLDRKLQRYYMSWGNSNAGGFTQYKPPDTVISSNNRGSAFAITGENAGAGGLSGGTSFGNTGLGSKGFLSSVESSTSGFGGSTTEGGFFRGGLRKLQDYTSSWMEGGLGGTNQYTPPDTISASATGFGSVSATTGGGVGGFVGGTPFGNTGGLGAGGFLSNMGSGSSSGGSGNGFSFGNFGTNLSGGFRKLQDYTSSWMRGGLGGTNQYTPPDTISASSTGVGSVSATTGGSTGGSVNGFGFGSGGSSFSAGDPGDNSSPSGLFGSSYGSRYFGSFGGLGGWR